MIGICGDKKRYSERTTTVFGSKTLLTNIICRSQARKYPIAVKKKNSCAIPWASRDTVRSSELCEFYEKFDGSS